MTTCSPSNSPNDMGWMVARDDHEDETHYPLGDPPPTEIMRTTYQARDSELREAALLAIGGAGYRVDQMADTKCYLTIWHMRSDGRAVADMAAIFGLRPWPHVLQAIPGRIG